MFSLPFLSPHSHVAASAVSESALVACNIYISSASSDSVLQNLLMSAQDHCQYIREHGSSKGNSDEIPEKLAHSDLDSARHGYGWQSKKIGTGTDNRTMSNRCRYTKTINPVAIVHAYADVFYDRSSFHLAGRSDCVADAAINLILNSFDKIDFDCTAQNDSAHPFVGLVDHVSVMPLSSIPVSDNASSLTSIISEQDALMFSRRAAVDAAKAIGDAITNSQQHHANVLFYGLACPNNTPLAKVRREKTSFFKSGGLRCSNDNNVETKNLKGDCTIGVPPNFVENFNIRMSPNVSISQAKTLTQFLRGRNISTKGFGIEGVEALTLPYEMINAAGDKTLVYEVACNLTNPKNGSVHKIEKSVDVWVAEQVAKSSTKEREKIDTNYFIDKMYRVGTTEAQCINSLVMGCGESDSENVRYWENHDSDVFDKFQQGLMQKH
ncbi:hypothetical protein HJC23_003983 [Cyclotella cryptica]|uniref:Formiminotransferase N-terminal subdomain domain-containing protein n=1 Tax=Cyclotella cryptica TaxID=29204 RepID=A0ABD3QVJ3_9STRA|eukprot:CCRYP_001960-RA/>CCRYP_001960-RA protein AED:0.37 eAED:0.37 QI:0/-1/0/1/-1/1/1/0/437